MFLLKRHGFGKNNHLKMGHEFTPIGDDESSMCQFFLFSYLSKKCQLKAKKAVNNSTLTDDKISIEDLSMHFLEHLHASLLIGGISEF